MRFELIVTVGPSILGRMNILKEIDALGPSIYRLNGAHCLPEHVASIAGEIRAHLPEARIMIDLPGNKIRTANLSEPIRFAAGDRFSIFSHQLNYAGFPKHLKEGDIVLANDSRTRFEVLAADDGRIDLLACHDGELLSNKGLHVPGVTAELPFLFERDRALVEAASAERLSFVSLSYVRTAEDVREAKNLLCDLSCSAEIIAKIETMSAVHHLGDILKEVPAVNIDRGDLSTETGLLGLCEYQESIVAHALAAGRRIFLATQFLKNMELSPVPLISEILDLGNSVKRGISGIQLSEETAVGKHPFECARLVWDIVEKHRGSGA